MRRKLGIIAALLALVIPNASAQSDPTALQSRVQQLESSLAKAEQQVSESHQEIQELRRQMELIQARQAGGATSEPKPTDTSGNFPTLENALKDAPGEAPAGTPESQEVQQELQARVEEQAQTKVESASRYKVRLSGMVLMNTYTNTGNVDVADLPNLVFPKAPGQTHGNIGASLRQSLIGLDVTGPTLAGAKTSADIQADFFGGFPEANYGETAGLVRLRIARMRMDWQKTSVVVGQDAPFFSPLSPTSYATIGEPAFAWSGNLWVWTPQIRVEHHWNLSDQSAFTAQVGLLDPLTEQEPPSQFNRAPTFGESSRRPAGAARMAWSGKIFGRDAAVGVGGFYERQTFGFDRSIDGWAVTTDWNLPLAPWATLSGEFFRGKGLGGLGGGVWNSALYNGTPSLATTRVIGLGDIGGWSQLKLQPITKLEFNVAAGTDNPLASDLRLFPNPTGTYFTPFARNQSAFVNTIYHPRSNLILALEYRRMRSYYLAHFKQSADHINLAIGVSF